MYALTAHIAVNAYMIQTGHPSMPSFAGQSRATEPDRGR